MLGSTKKKDLMHVLLNKSINGQNSTKRLPFNLGQEYPLDLNSVHFSKNYTVHVSVPQVFSLIVVKARLCSGVSS